MDIVGKIIAYESGDCDEVDTADLFQELIDTGLAFQLQGAYGREAVRLIEAGACSNPHGAGLAIRRSIR